MKVCILGADRLLAVVPNRDPRKTISLAMLSPDGKLAERTGSSKRKSVYNKWNAEDSLSGKCNNYFIIYEYRALVKKLFRTGVLRIWLFRFSFNCICLLGAAVEVCVALKLDNCYVGQSAWKPLGKECWKEQFHIELDKVHLKTCCLTQLDQCSLGIREFFRQSFSLPW